MSSDHDSVLPPLVAQTILTPSCFANHSFQECHAVHAEIITSLIGLILAVLILYLVRRDHLYLMHGVWWSLVAAAAALLGAWPGLIDTLAAKPWFCLPPAFLLLLASVVLLIKALHADMLFLGA